MSMAMPTAKKVLSFYTFSLVCLAAISLVLASCASTPTTVSPVRLPTLEEKFARILQLEDLRVLDEPFQQSELNVADRELVSSLEGRQSEFLQNPELIELLDDPIASIRRRAALALGRVGLSDAVAPLVDRLGDPEPEVRQMAAFALGLIGDSIASQSLRGALNDASAKVRGRAAQALGRLGDTTAAESIGALVQRYAPSAYDLDPDDLSYPQRDEVEAFRLGVYALADLGTFEPLASAILDGDRPIVWWWPVAHALRSFEDVRALNALLALVEVQGSVGVAIAATGLGMLGDPKAVGALIELLDLERRDARVVSSALSALGMIEDQQAADALDRFVRRRELPPLLRLKAVEALEFHGNPNSIEVFTELVTHPWPSLRAASFRALSKTEPDTFLRVLSGFGSDENWIVRQAIADGLRQVDQGIARQRLSLMLDDENERVLASVLEALVDVEAPNFERMLTAYLDAPVVSVRRTAARLIGQLQIEGAESLLAEAYRSGLSDTSHWARISALEAIASFGSSSLVKEILRLGLKDPEWVVRVRASELLGVLDPSSSFELDIRPAPNRDIDYSSPHLVSPVFSPHVFIETARGTIEIELSVLEAPLATDYFMRLIRQGFYDGLAFLRMTPNCYVQGIQIPDTSDELLGQSVLDELSQLPFLRGTVGMSKDSCHAGRGQFFITNSPQPELNTRFTVIGRVVSGMDVVDTLLPDDVIERATVWDGLELPLQ